MPRRKKAQDKEDELAPSKKRTRGTPLLRRPIRKPVPETTRAAETLATRRSRRGKLSAPLIQDSHEILSDSSSLSDPPSEVVPPTPPDTTPSQLVSNEMKVKRAFNKNPSQVSSKEHEDALNLFIRDVSDDDSSDTSSEEGQSNELEVATDPSGDEDEGWEDIDLSHKKQVSLDDLNKSSETPDLEVTLERTQQSMRIK